MDKYYSFVFKGLLTEEALDKAGRKNPALLSKIENAELEKRLCIDQVEDSILIKAQNMSLVFIAIYSFENTVRAFVEKKLLEEIGENWWDDSVPESIRKKAAIRKDEEDKIKWHTQRGESLIQFIDFGDLSSIINKKWDLFQPHLNSYEWANQLFKSVERSRNVIMHSGYLSMTDIERVGALIRDWYNQTSL
ncbi:Swt1 family HEPN domain-containing protein [Aquiflexum gelatinilyticum]|uniref:Swt1 family HEPN domain-containing protein n=1 Tax=Aquiflexum gelatinilyticum TaxID=2961943 RepID=A0A9X2P2N4_9BACT|nr:Swt1 family HEPN domain-containing protein [Aquiflexum gelatinilyticum]MCR9013807.1 Swt1 family HEPN domain-containing protein [Aquiflexum gelatinilyticum]